jgi:preprotein translocase subunit SecA
VSALSALGVANPDPETAPRQKRASPQANPKQSQGIRAVLEAVQTYDFKNHSDTDLTNTMTRLRSNRSNIAINRNLAEIIATISEVIDRRLGIWQIFDPEFNHSTLPDSVQACWRAGETTSLDEDQQTIVDTLLLVNQESQVKRPWDISLPAEFYQAVRCGDTSGVLAFQATTEQLLAGLHLYRGNIVQMNAGEGKTAAGIFPAILHAMAGTSVHVITANDYLAARDADLLASVYRFLGFSVGAVLGYMEDDERRYNYQQAIVYSTMRELGFDHLRDNLKTTAASRVHRKLDAAIIDEADHGLIDEASTPMIISGAPLGTRSSMSKVKKAITQLITLQKGVTQGLADKINRSDTSLTHEFSVLCKLLLAEPNNDALEQHWRDNPRRYREIKAAIEQDQETLTSELYYVIDPDRRFVTLADKGRDYLTQILGPFYDGRSLEDSLEAVWRDDHLPLAARRKKAASISTRLARQYNLGNQVYQMLRAYLLLQRDVDYLVAENQLVLIDKGTGRPKPDAIYQHGLQPALEAKESLPPNPESETLAHITVEGFVKQYRSVCGMTGTAISSEDEFHQKYGIPVTVLPPTHALHRVDLGSRVYLNNIDKNIAIVEQVASSHDQGQPVLVGTLTVEQSQEISHLLFENNIPHNLLNAVNSDTEAQLIKNAGAFGAVTVATNMAGRGTDILLESDLDEKINQRNVQLTEDSLKNDNSGTQTMEHSLGLRVIGTELNETPRIDLQLSGRSGRQGSLGVSQTFLSLEDRLLSLHVDGILKTSKCRYTDTSGRTYYSGDEIDRHILQVQRNVEGEAEVQRALVQDYASVLDHQTESFYRQRREIVDSGALDGGPNIWARIAQEHASSLVSAHFQQVTLEEYHARFDNLVEEIQLDHDVDCSPLRGCDMNLLPQELGILLTSEMTALEHTLGAKEYAAVARALYLKTCDDLWKSHIVSLQDSISNQLLATSEHRSAVALYIRSSFQTWDGFWDRVNAEFLPRLLTFSHDTGNPLPSIQVNEEVQTLIADRSMTPAAGSTGRN